VLGRDKTIKRLERAINIIEPKNGS
jgi:hypothetical protein